MEELKVNKAEIVKVYNTASEETKQAMVKVFGKDVFKFDYAQIKTYEDACERLGIIDAEPKRLGLYDEEALKQAQALYKLLIIQKAINNGVWSDEDGYSYFPCWVLYSKEEMEAMSDDDKQRKGIRQLLSCAYVDETGAAGVRYAYAGNRGAYTYANCGFPLCYNSEEAALYAGRRFESLFFEYYGIKVKENNE